ncbi:MAG: UDP-glucose 4-epimerase GalE [Saprospiraceae bacterium]|nr:UDP-glucose 4-epimerase GalE [Saprospiraceae bacterium]
MAPSILVTGGAGFIGSHTVVALAEAGYRPVILDDFSNSDQRVLKGLETILGYEPPCYAQDCNDLPALRRVVQAENIRGAIHFAACKAVGESMQEPLRYYRNNLGSLIALMDALLEYGAPDLIFSSSCTVYGEPDQLPVTENTPVKPAISVYGNTKQIGEEILRDTAAAGKALRSISLRYFNPIGAHSSAQIGELPLGVPNNLVPFITQTAAGLRSQLTVFGNDYPTPDGSCIRDYIHVMDLAEAHVAALAALEKRPEKCCYEIYNVGAGQGTSVLELIQTFEAVLGKPLPHRIGDRRPGDIAAVYADASKIQRELHWTARRSMRQALEDAWRWELELGKKHH